VAGRVVKYPVPGPAVFADIRDHVRVATVAFGGRCHAVNAPASPGCLALR